MNPENEIDKTEALEPVETAAANVAEARGGVDGRKRPKWLLPLIAVVCAVVLVVAGVVGWNMYRGAKLAEAKEACATAADGVRSQANEYNALLNGDAADAARCVIRARDGGCVRVRFGTLLLGVGRVAAGLGRGTRRGGRGGCAQVVVTGRRGSEI